MHRIELVMQKEKLFIRKDDNYILTFDEYLVWLNQEKQRRMMLFTQRGL